MDKIKLNNIKRSIELYQIFLGCLQDTYDKAIESDNKEDYDDLLRLLKIQHDNNRITLQSLGINFNDKDKIRNLNLKIHDLEKKLGENENINPQILSSYVSNLTENLRKFLADHGLYCNPEITVGKVFSIKLKHISAYSPFSDYDARYLRDESEYNDLYEEKTRRNLSAINNFLFDSQHKIYFLEDNTNFIDSLLQEFFNEMGTLRGINYDLAYYKSQKSEKDLKIHEIQTISFSLATMASYSNFFGE